MIVDLVYPAAVLHPTVKHLPTEKNAIDAWRTRSLATFSGDRLQRIRKAFAGVALGCGMPLSDRSGRQESFRR